jgi:uncharacterized protein YkwD
MVPRPHRSHLLVPFAVVALALALAVGGPAPAAAADAPVARSAASVEGWLLDLINDARDARGLRPLRRDARLAIIADERALALVQTSSFSHAAAGGSLSVRLATAGVQWYRWGENLAAVSGGLTRYTARAIYLAWQRSPAHWRLLMSRDFNYLGLGVAARASTGRVFASAVFTESRDHTRPSARIDTARRTGTTVSFTWHGYDAPLQTHWAGMRDYDVWYRIDGGPWRVIRDNTTATSIRLASRPRGHRYWLMVQPRDRAGNVGSTSAPVGVWVP